MFWNRISGIYDLIENTFNGKVNRDAVQYVASLVGSEDIVLECACGTGMFSVEVAKKCSQLTATDLGEKMLEQAKKKCKGLDNVRFELANITALPYADSRFDCVIAANVIHLLNRPEKALDELRRVCRRDGKIIIPTYINDESKTATAAAGFFNCLGAGFQRQFNTNSYKQFFVDLGFENVEYKIFTGRMPCDVAVIKL